jgi:hypothetical protein
MTEQQAIKAAFRSAQALRPYRLDYDVLEAITPPGGGWQAVARDGAITRSVLWGGIEVANVNPVGSLDDETEGQIAMGLRATPVLDTALRAILHLASQGLPNNMILISKIAETAIAFIEFPAPPCRAREIDDIDPTHDDEEPF